MDQRAGGYTEPAGRRQVLILAMSNTCDAELREILSRRTNRVRMGKLDAPVVSSQRGVEDEVQVRNPSHAREGVAGERVVNLTSAAAFGFDGSLGCRTRLNSKPTPPGGGLNFNPKMGDILLVTSTASRMPWRRVARYTEWCIYLPPLGFARSFKRRRAQIQV